MIKSVLSVLAGYAVMVLFTMVLFAILAALSPEEFGMDAEATPGNISLLVILLVGLASALSGGWVTGRLAPGNPSRHVNALVLLILLMSILSFSMEGAEKAPLWYSIGLMIVGISGAWLGGRLRRAQIQV